MDLKVPRFTGALASVLIIGTSLGYGAVKGGHLPVLVDWFRDTRDAAANAAGFRITSIALSGEKHLGVAEIAAAAGITERASLLFLDVDDARARLKADPWIAEATVRKLFPDRLAVSITEREPFALWQMEGRVSVIAADGTVLGPLRDPVFASLPLVVGRGAALKAREFLASLDHHRQVRDQVRASILVAERRWNLRLKNGLDVRLPEGDIDSALDLLASLDRDKRLLSRDITLVDLRLPDRVTVRLSDDVARAREELRKQATKRKGGDA